MWGYLSEFWGSVASTTLSAWEYTEDWFYNIGNAVAGAIGNLFYSLLHYGNDTFVFFGWISELIKNIISVFLLPLSYIFTFLKSFFVNALGAPIEFEEYTWTDEVLSVFNAIPLWSEMITAIGVALTIIVVFFVLRTFLKS